MRIRLSTPALAALFLAMSAAAAAMLAMATGRKTFETPEDKIRFWIERFAAEAPQPSKETLLSLYRLRPLDELAALMQTGGPSLSRAAADALREIWRQDLGPERESRLNEAELMLADGFAGAAMALADELAGEAPLSAEPLHFRAQIWFALGEYERGKADCQTALSRNERHWPSLRDWGAAALEAGDRPAAEQALNALRRIAPNASFTRRLESRLSAAADRSGPSQASENPSSSS